MTSSENYMQETKREISKQTLEATHVWICGGRSRAEAQHEHMNTLCVLEEATHQIRSCDCTEKGDMGSGSCKTKKEGNADLGGGKNTQRGKGTTSVFLLITRTRFPGGH